MYFNQVEFGQRVKALRKENGLTLQQMADELNVSYEHYKKGRSFETLHIQKQLSAAQDILAGLMKDLK